MLCPVCKTECGQSNTCKECGFSQVGKVFINEEEAKHWFNTTVIPYKSNYYKSNVLSPIDWVAVFKQNAQAKRLFEFSIPVALKRRAALEGLKNPRDEDYNMYLKDATLGHIAIVSTSDVVRKHFMDAIEEAYHRTISFNRVVSNCVEKEGDLAAVLSNINPGDALVFEINSRIKKGVVSLFSRALSEFILDIIIGKGPGARKICLDLPVFTTIFVAELTSAIPDDIANTLDAVIEINPSADELTELQIREAAPFYDVELTKANIEVIKEAISQNTFKNAKSILKYVSDYLYLHPELQQPLSREETREIIKNIC